MLEKLWGHPASLPAFTRVNLQKVEINTNELINFIPTLPSPSRDYVALREKGRHSGESRNPVFDFIQFFKILDARLRGHDELRHSLQGGRVREGVMSLYLLRLYEFQVNLWVFWDQAREGGEA